MKLPLQSFIFSLHLEKHHQDEECHRGGVTLLEPALCCGKERSLWQKCLQAGSEATVQLMRSWTRFLQITSLMLQVCCADYATR